MVFADTRSAGTWYLLDGHLRLEALKELGFAKVECLVATDDDTYTYNKRVNRLAPIQKHRMIARAIERGVSSADIADALGLQVESVIRRADSDEAAPLFRDDCAPGFRDDLAPCLVGSAGDDCCQFIQARCQALRGRFRRRLSPLNSMRWALWTNLSSMASA
ncbi:plasmid partitioning protein RepB C-terminal domain-containing protein [Sinorhizobium meliloti]|uniref:plasmid partitioning protein RepB C-terminal domain-containing protein n=1 Tax=Rhizobium meliloti TaxID=382 RepID=UPI00307EC0A4